MSAAEPPPSLVFLEPVDPRLAARKVHRLIQRGDGRPELVTDGYGNPLRFRHFSTPVADVDDLFAALQAHSPLNRFAVRGGVRPDAGPVIYRRKQGDHADILDSASAVVAVDLDNEPAPADLDTSDIQAVGDYLRGRMPAELRAASCVVQLSAGYGLDRWRPGPAMLKARLWFVNDAPMDGPALRRWFTLANRRGDCAQMDPSVATANQPIYTAAPLFQGVADPVPVRLALLYGDQDVATIRPPDAPAPVVYAAGAIGERCPARLAALVKRIQAAAESGQPRHPTINSMAFTAGRLVAGGAFTADEALAALLPPALETGSAGAERAVRDGLAAGMKALPIKVGAARVDAGAPVAPALPDLPTAQEAVAALDARLIGFFEAVKRGESPKLGIAGAAGLGKTTRALALAHERGVTVDHFVPTQKLAQEQVARLPPGAAIAIRGRTHADENRAPLCAKHEAADALQAAGLGNQAQVFLCGKYDFAAQQFPCPHGRGCAYHAQFNSKSPIRFYSHDWLTIAQKERPGFKAADVAIVDESFSASFETKHRWTLESLAEAGGLFFDIGDAIRNGTLNQADHGAAIAAALKIQTGHSFPPIHPEMTAQEAIFAARQWQSLPRAKTPPYDLLRAARDVIKSGESRRLYAETLNDKTTIYFDAVKPLAIESPAWLFLDASLSPGVVHAVMPGTEIVEIQAKRNAHFIQITDSALSLARLAANNDHLMSRVAEFVERLKLSNPNGAVIGPKDFMEAAQAAGYFKGLATGHYGALRGLNTMEAAAWLVQIGRNEPPGWAVERKARAWFAGDPDLDLGTVQRLPGWIHGPDGAVETGAVTTFTDAHCREILESLREQESLQGIDRLRLVHAAKPKAVYLLSNLPLPGIRPDVLTTLDKLLLPGRLAEVMLRDGAITGDSMLAKRHPDLFETEKQAGHALTTLQTPVSLYRLHIGIPGFEAPAQLVPVSYRTGSQKGGKPRRALLYEPTAAGPLLEGLHGEPVTLREADPREDQRVNPLHESHIGISAIEAVEPVEVVEVVVEPAPPPDPPPAAGPPTSAAHIPTYAMPTHMRDLYAAINAAIAKLATEARTVATSDGAIGALALELNHALPHPLCACHTDKVPGVFTPYSGRRGAESG